LEFICDVTQGSFLGLHRNSIKTFNRVQGLRFALDVNFGSVTTERFPVKRFKVLISSSLLSGLITPKSSEFHVFEALMAGLTEI
jgi:hypothetical protein